MKRTALRKTLTTGFAASLLWASIGLAADPAHSTRVKAQPAARQQTARKAMAFKTERTDSWLCNYVSPLFCSNLVPSLSSSSNVSTTSSHVPDRSRHD